MDYLQYFGVRPNQRIARKRSFKPYYKWITFNTQRNDRQNKSKRKVLNLIINGLPSILFKYFGRMYDIDLF